MEALNFLRFWISTHKENQRQSCNRNNGGSGSMEISKSMVVVSDPELDEGEDSFIDLELSLLDKGNVRGSDCRDKNVNKRFDDKEDEAVVLHEHEPHKELNLQKQARSLSPSDHISKRKIIPIELSSNSKPQSPIALLKSAPKFRVFTLNKSKSMANTSNNTNIAEKSELVGISMETPKHEKQDNRSSSSKHFKVKFQIEESPNHQLPIFARETSLRKTIGKTENSLLDDSSKRFSKDLIQKYLNIIKPFYVKVSKKNIQSDKTKVSCDLSMSSPAASPATVFSAREKQGNLCKHLGKSRSASATSSPISRRDDSLLLQHDGIQSAILHCKKSFNSSRESSWLSRGTSDSS